MNINIKWEVRSHFSCDSDTENMYLALLVVVTVIISPATNHAYEFEDELSTPFDRYQTTCSEHFGSSLQKSWLTLIGRLDNQVETSPTKCWMTCVLKKMGLMSDGKIVDYNEMTSDSMTAAFAHANHLDRNSTKCMEKANSSKGDICEHGYIYLDCEYEEWLDSISWEDDDKK